MLRTRGKLPRVSEPRAFLAATERVGIRHPTAEDADEFVALMTVSRDLHHPWGEYPTTHEKYADYLARRQHPAEPGFLVCERATGAIAGVINISNIVRGFFQSAFLGYYVGQPFAGRGYMTEGLRLVTRYAFDELQLHRLEANIQPDNAPSIALVRRLGFRREGFSPRYLKICGQWRDHERWALLVDDPQ
jgi:ribosomal-protein-alanine N-acetyltransferase